MSISILAQSSSGWFHAWMIVLLVLGFGFVIFWHELGHFLAAKWVGVKVEQFAVGFGQALFAWRKGIGLRWGSTQKEYYGRIEEYLNRSRSAKSDWSDREISQAADELRLGETEYRLNWIPLGGYVKMLGQDDLRPDAAANDPRAYNRKSVGARMIVISAGVIMNVILAALLFIGVFLMGLNAQPAWVGSLIPQSPAQKAGLKVGDQIKTFNGHAEEDFTKITLDTALAKDGSTVPITVQRPTADGKLETLTLSITPERPENGRGFVELGLGAPVKLEAISKEDAEGLDLKKVEANLGEPLVMRPGDVITAINGQSVTAKDFPMLDAAAQQFGRPVELTIKSADGGTHTASVQPHFLPFFGGGFNLAGMSPRAKVAQVTEDSAAQGKLKSGDVVARIVVHSNPPVTLDNPDREKLVDVLKSAGSSGDSFDITVARPGSDKPITFPDLKATAAVGDTRTQKGLGVQLDFDEANATLSEVTKDTPAAAAALAAGDTITAVNDQPVGNWYDLHRLLSAVSAGQEVRIAYTRNGQAQQATLKLDEEQLASIHRVRYHTDLVLLAPLDVLRQAPNALVAVKWGVMETRDFLLQFYVTIQRMFEGSVSLSNMMGPVGIFIGGKKFAYKGYDWLLWFLAMISANLAVVNFLPIPVVDGGQFVFLMLEKIKGRPLSTRTMVIAQYVGLAFLAAVVVFVTYHDIMRRY